MKMDAVRFSEMYVIIWFKCVYVKLCMEANHKSLQIVYDILSLIIADAVKEMLLIFGATGDKNSVVRICT